MEKVSKVVKYYTKVRKCFAQWSATLWKNVSNESMYTDTCIKYMARGQAARKIHKCHKLVSEFKEHREMWDKILPEEINREGRPEELDFINHALFEELTTP